MFELVAELVRGMGLPWSGAAYLIIVAVALYFLLKISLRVSLFCSYLVVCSLRRASKQLPVGIYVAESILFNALQRMKAALRVAIVLIIGWVFLFLARGSLEGEKLLALERHMTAVVAGWVQAGN